MSVGVSSSGSAGVDAGVEVRGRVQILVSQQLADQLIRPRVGVEGDLGCQMPELMRSDFHAQMPQNGCLDGDLDRSLASRLARQGDEHRIGTLADHCRGNLVPINLEALGKLRRNLELECGRRSWSRRRLKVISAGLRRPCGQCKCSSKFRAARFCMRSGTWMRRSIARALCRAMNGRRDVARPRRAARQSRSGSWTKAARRRGSSNLRSRPWFFSVRPDGSVPSLRRRALSVAQRIRGRLHPFRGDRDQRVGEPVGVEGQRASVLLAIDDAGGPGTYRARRGSPER